MFIIDFLGVRGFDRKRSFARRPGRRTAEPIAAVSKAMARVTLPAAAPPDAAASAIA